ncbi:hypothetical protein YDYSY3_26980 [Paenibacillus chitinolyticus]|uniref:hypothetical protein n=1 Tax=Paenibacillus chitinolyticus TaxID=79263 RepID=UPI0026E4E8E4|nr:hypothetical protein [Paenibacillus chitinolyticus]GKS11698.1 hypothetical protein YDYSY3_26980 [Paenibacillus chitinolyticus]
MNYKKMIAVSTPILLLCMPALAANAATNKSITYPYSSGSCSGLQCSDYYADHFALNLYWDPVIPSSPLRARIANAESTYTFTNQNGDRWTTQALKIWNTGNPNVVFDTPVFSSSNYTNTYSVSGNSSYYQTWNVGAIVTTGDNYTMAYYKLDLYTPGGSPAGTYYPKRYRQNFN